MSGGRQNLVDYLSAGQERLNKVIPSRFLRERMTLLFYSFCDL